MIEQVKTAYRYLLVMGIGLLLLLLSVLIPVLSSNADFSIYNSGWNGCSGLGKDVYETGSFLPSIDISGSTEERIVHNSFSEYGDELDSASSTIIVIGPDLSFSDDEGTFIHDFLMDGGTLLLADDVGEGNDLLRRLNTESRFTGETMLDLSFEKSWEFSVTTDVEEHPVTENVTMLLLNMPSTIRASKEAQAVVNSSGSSWLDLDDDRKKDIDEPGGPLNLLTIENYGRGELVLFSEPSLLINQMRDRMDNGILVNNLIEYISRGKETILIDESHRDLTNPVQVLNIFVSSFDPGEKIGLLLVISVIFVIANTPYPKRIYRSSETFFRKLLREGERTRPSLDEIRSRVMKKHPEWDQRIMDRLVEDIGGNE